MPEISPIGQTALLVAASRARESKRNDRLFNDPYAEALAGPVGMQMLNGGFAPQTQSADQSETDKRNTDAYLAIRTSHFDYLLLQAASQGLNQFVNLAAGLDSRAFRLNWPNNTHCYELDRAEVFTHKEPILASNPTSPTPQCQRTTVTADLLTNNWPQALTAAGFDTTRPALVLIEGLLMYLTPTEADTLIDRVCNHFAPGSKLIFDTINAQYLTSPYTKPYLEQLERMGCPWRFGVDEPETWLAARGWIAHVHRPGEPGVGLHRWPYPLIPRETPAVPHLFLVTADRPPTTH